MRILSCASYYGTGSSAVTDYFSEFQTVKSVGEYEFRFLHDTDGVADLEYHLVWNHNRHNSGHALKRFKKIVDFYSGSRFAPRYEAYFHGQWKKLAYEYMDALTDFSFKGWWQYDLLDRGLGYYYWKLLINKVYKLTLGRKNERVLNVLPDEITYCSRPSQEKFDEATKTFLRKLMSAANPENIPVLMLDQLLPSSNLHRFWKFFDDIKVVVVDRDPRDLYILEKMEWKGSIIPTDDVETFCKWYKLTREHRKTEAYDPEHAILIQFEDLIYRYPETTEKIREWVGLDEADHIHKLQKLDPERSKKNTRTWEKYDIGQDLQYIEKELKEYLYDYDSLGIT